MHSRLGLSAASAAQICAADRPELPLLLLTGQSCPPWTVSRSHQPASATAFTSEQLRLAASYHSLSHAGVQKHGDNAPLREQGFQKLLEGGYESSAIVSRILSILAPWIVATSSPPL